jgi:hypothetical protein
MEDNMRLFYLTVIVAMGLLLFITGYWLSRTSDLIKRLAEALHQAGCQMTVATSIIESQREDIRILKAEVAELSGTKVVNFPSREPRQ